MSGIFNKHGEHPFTGSGDVCKHWIDSIDYAPDFLDESRAGKFFSWLQSRPEWQQEDGYCPKPGQQMKAQHDTLQWGPRQAYLTCVPKEFRIVSSGPIPAKLSKLHSEVCERYQACFNSIQVNRHWNENSGVHAHSDHMFGDIVMLSLGEPRRFIVRYLHNDKATTLNRWKAGDILFDEVLPHGSLLTIRAKHQVELTHEMPKAGHPCGVRMALIWRYITQADTKYLSRQSYIEGRDEFVQAQKNGRKA